MRGVKTFVPAVVLAVGWVGAGWSKPPVDLHNESARPESRTEPYLPPKTLDTPYRPTKEAEDLLADGRRLTAAKEYEKALAAYDKAFRAGCRDLEALQDVAWLCNQIGEFRWAKAAAERAIDWNGGVEFAWLELGYAEWKLKNPKAAIRALDKTIDLNFYLPDAHAYLAAVYDEQGEREEAAFAKECEQAAVKALARQRHK